jgi:hypothetical protein
LGRLLVASACGLFLLADSPSLRGQEAAGELKPGDKVQLDWAGQTVEGEVLERSATGWFKVKFVWNGREMTPTLPPKNLRPVAGEKAAAQRTWKDATGKFEIAASFAGKDDSGVLLKKSDGKTIRVPLDKLSKEDHAYVEELLKAEAAQPEKKPAEPANPFEAAEVVRPARTPAKAAAQAKEYDREADYSVVQAIVPQAAGKGFVPDAEQPLPVQPSDKAAALSGSTSGNERFFESPRSVLIAKDKGEAVVVLVNGPPGGERTVRVLRCDLATMKPLGEAELASFSTPVSISPSGSTLACFPDWTARHHGEKEMIEIVRIDGEKLTPIRRWAMGDHSQGDQRFEQLHLIGEDKLLTTSAWGGGIVLWDIEKAQAIWQLKLQSHHQPALSANRKQVAAMIDGKLGIFDTATGDTLARLNVETEPTGVLSFSPDGRRIAILGNRVLRVYDIANGRLSGEMWFPKQMFARSLDWASDNYVLVDKGFLVDLEKRVVVWEYDLPTGKPDAIATMAGGRYWVVSGGGNSGCQLAGLVVPDAAARAKAESLTAEQLLAVRPGAAVTIRINLPKATQEEVQKVTKVLIDEVKAAGLVLAPNAPITIECSISDAGKEEATYQTYDSPPRPFGPIGPLGPFGPRFGRDSKEEEATVEKRLSVLAVKENGKELWVATGHYGAPFHITIKEGQTVQEAVNEQKGNPVQFFLTAKVPRYLARHGETGSYGKSKLWP